MTDMYDKPKNYEGGRMKPYAHNEMPVGSVSQSSVQSVHYTYFSNKNVQGRAADPVGYLQSVEQRARERQIAYETVKLLRRDVIACYRKEGVNHYENCRKEYQALYDVISKKDLGQVHPKWSDEKMNDGW